MNLLITGAWPDAKAHISQIETMGHSVIFLQTGKREDALQTDGVKRIIARHRAISVNVNVMTSFESELTERPDDTGRIITIQITDESTDLHRLPLNSYSYKFSIRVI